MRFAALVAIVLQAAGCAFTFDNPAERHDQTSVNVRVTGLDPRADRVQVQLYWFDQRPRDPAAASAQTIAAERAVAAGTERIEVELAGLPAVRVSAAGIRRTSLFVQWCEVTVLAQEYPLQRFKVAVETDVKAGERVAFSVGLPGDATLPDAGDIDLDRTPQEADDAEPAPEADDAGEDGGDIESLDDTETAEPDAPDDTPETADDAEETLNDEPEGDDTPDADPADPDTADPDAGDPDTADPDAADPDDGEVADPDAGDPDAGDPDDTADRDFVVVNAQVAVVTAPVFDGFVGGDWTAAAAGTFPAGTTAPGTLLLGATAGDLWIAGRVQPGRRDAGDAFTIVLEPAVRGGGYRKLSFTGSGTAGDLVTIACVSGASAACTTAAQARFQRITPAGEPRGYEFEMRIPYAEAGIAPGSTAAVGVGVRLHISLSPAATYAWPETLNVDAPPSFAAVTPATTWGIAAGDDDEEAPDGDDAEPTEPDIEEDIERVCTPGDLRCIPRGTQVWSTQLCRADGSGYDDSSCPDPAWPAYAQVCITVQCVAGVGGACQWGPVDGTCDDGNPCTQNDACDAGFCRGTPKACNDGNPCTRDFCNPATGLCVAEADVTVPACDDGDPCTVGDRCNGTRCDPGTRIEDCCPNRPDMALVTGTPAGDYCIDRWEATAAAAADCTGTVYGRVVDDYPAGFPDANTTAAQTTPVYACSTAGVQPSAFITFDQAAAACANAGKVLCPESVRTFACRNGTAALRFPTGSQDADAALCNGLGFSTSPRLRNTGEAASCRPAQYPVFDLSGNLSEWAGPSSVECGGTFSGGPQQLECLACPPASGAAANRGFRCCLAQ